MPSSTPVLLGGNGLHVVWPDADAVSTEMIQLQSIRDWPYGFFVPGPMGSQPPALMEHATPASFNCAQPIPATNCLGRVVVQPIPKRQVERLRHSLKGGPLRYFAGQVWNLLSRHWPGATSAIITVSLSFGGHIAMINPIKNLKVGWVHAQFVLTHVIQCAIRPVKGADQLLPPEAMGKDGVESIQATISPLLVSRPQPAVICLVGVELQYLSERCTPAGSGRKGATHFAGSLPSLVVTPAPTKGIMRAITSRHGTSPTPTTPGRSSCARSRKAPIVLCAQPRTTCSLGAVTLIVVGITHSHRNEVLHIPALVVVLASPAGIDGLRASSLLTECLSNHRILWHTWNSSAHRALTKAQSGGFATVTRHMRTPEDRRPVEEYDAKSPGFGSESQLPRRKRLHGHVGRVWISKVIG